MKSTAGSLYLFRSCFQWVRRAMRLASDSWWLNYFVYSQSVNASFTCDLKNWSVRFWIVFLTEHKVFDILSVLADTHRTRSAAAQLLINRIQLFGFFLTECRYFHILSTCYEPVWDWKNLCVNKILFNVVYSQNNMLLTAKFVTFWVLWFPKVRQLHRLGEVGNETIFRRYVDWLLTVPKIIVIGQLLLKILNQM